MLFSYTFLTVTTTPLSTWAFKNNSESIAEALKINPSLEFDSSFVMGGGPTLYAWIFTLAVIACAGSICVLFIIKHTSIILKNHQRFSKSSRDMHRSAITALIIQSIAVLSSTLLPVLMLCIMVFIGPSSIPFPDVYGSCAALLFSLKSFNATVAMICTTACYRNNFFSITGISRLLTKYYFQTSGALFVNDQRSLATSSG